jgi:hypothetical protein
MNLLPIYSGQRSGVQKETAILMAISRDNSKSRFQQKEAKDVSCSGASGLIPYGLVSTNGSFGGCTYCLNADSRLCHFVVVT